MELTNRSKRKLSEVQRSFFIEHFLSLRGTEEFSVQRSIRNFQKLDEEIPSDEDLVYCLLEDSIFSSLQATYYEEMFISVANNPKMAVELIQNFFYNKESRDDLIHKQTQLHLKYVTHEGHCEGCDQCENHGDVNELIEPYIDGDLDFFIKVYIGMESIYLALENNFFHYLPHNLQMVEEINRESIYEFRSFIFNFANREVSKLG